MKFSLRWEWPEWSILTNGKSPKCINICLLLIKGDNNGRTLVWMAKRLLNEGSTVLAFYIIMLIH